MLSHALPYDHRHRLPHWRLLGRSVLCVLWQIVRLPVLAILLVLEPLVSLALIAFGFLGIAVALILKFSSDLPHFPFWTMMAFAVGAILLLIAYEALIGILSN